MHLLLVQLNSQGLVLATELRELGAGDLIVGADPGSIEGSCPVPWGRPSGGGGDRYLSRVHARVRALGNQLEIRRVEPEPGRAPANAFHRIHPGGRSEQAEAEPIHLQPGEAVAVGTRGSTHFICLAHAEEASDVLAQLFPRSAGDPASPLGIGAGSDDYATRYQLRLLREELPQRVLAAWSEPEELFTRMGEFLQFALGPKFTSVAFCALNGEGLGAEIVNENPSLYSDFCPSQSRLERAQIAGTEHEEMDQGKLIWMAPVAASPTVEPFRDQRGRSLWLYLERKPDAPDPEMALPFARLVLRLTASLLDGWQKQRSEEQLSRYFSPALRKMILRRDPTELEPRMEECTMLFCDRRASSRAVEDAPADADVLQRLSENSEMLELISQVIFEHDGVIVDFAGDGVLAFWGWPETRADHAQRAAAAAAEIAHRMAPWLERNEAENRRHAAVRIGISSGRIAVGMTGVSQQRKIGVFGSAVNFGARLESLGKQFRVPVLISEETANQIRETTTVRRICRLKPAGFERAYPIHELVLEREVGGSGADLQRIKIYEQALIQFTARDWNGCRELLRRLPVDDEPTYWLERQVAWFQEHGTPLGWQGEVMTSLK